MLKQFVRIAITIATLGFGSAKAQDIVFALPSPSLTFATVFVAEDMGLFKKEGLAVDIRNLGGVGSINAVLAGSAHFTMGTATTFLRAASQGQRLLAIANLIDKPLVEMVLGNGPARRLGIARDMSIAERAVRLKGLTIGVHGVGSVIHAWARYVIATGGLNIEQDVRIAPMDPPSMLPALESGLIDGYATSIPYTTQAVFKGSAIMLASSLTDAPDLYPFAYGLLYARPQTCEKDTAVCKKMVRAFISASRLMEERPEEVFEKVLKKRFAAMDPGLLKQAWEQVRKAHAKDFRVTPQQLTNAQKISTIAQLLKEKEALLDFEGLYTDQFLK